MPDRRRSFLRILLAGLCLLPWLGVPAYAQDGDDALKQRFIERLPVLDQLRAEGAVGENNQGLLTLRNATLSDQEKKVIEAENRDRRQLYAKLASRLDLSPEEVGRQRAVQIAKRARKGVWLQTPDGEWYRKQ
ncbi:MAG: YdbL family protein [Opitutales bacterium]